MAISRDGYLQATCECPSTSQGSYHSWIHLIKSKETIPQPTSQGLALYLVQHQLLAWGVRCALHLHLGGYFAPWQFFPDCLSHQYSTLPSRITCGYMLLPRPEMFGQYSAPFTFFQVPITVQIPVSRHIWGGVGFRGHRWATASLQFALVDKGPLMILAMFKPSTISVSQEGTDTCIQQSAPDTLGLCFTVLLQPQAGSPFHLPYSALSSAP